jgi:hypothetical protein
MILLSLFASCVVDTGGKFGPGIVDTGGKFGTGNVDLGGKFAIGINNTSSGKIYRRCR